MNIDPNENLGYWIFYAHHRVSNTFGEALKRCCQEQNKPYVVTPPQWGVLVLLAETDGMTIGAISQKRRVDAPTMTGIVSRLEQGGLVERHHDRQDRRVVKVYLTPEGQDIIPYLMQTMETFNEVMAQGLSEEEYRDLLHKIKYVIANVSNVGLDENKSKGRICDEQE
jgi:DNA-binding MarR family transcriptional regulator